MATRNAASADARLFPILYMLYGTLFDMKERSYRTLVQGI